MDFYGTIMGYVCKNYGKMVKQWIGGAQFSDKATWAIRVSASLKKDSS